MISVQFVCQNMTTKQLIKSSTFLYEQWNLDVEAQVKANRVRLLTTLQGYRVFTVIGEGRLL